MFWSGPKSNTSKILCLSLLPASLTKIRSKMKALSSVRTTFLLLQVYGSFWLPCKPVLIQTAPNAYAAFPLPSNVTHKLWLRLANWTQRYSSLNAQWTEDVAYLYYKLTHEPKGSGFMLRWAKNVFFSSLNTQWTEDVAYLYYKLTHEPKGSGFMLRWAKNVF